MGTISSLITAGAVGLGTTISTVNKDGSVNNDNLNSTLITTATTTATVVGGTLISESDYQKIHAETTSAYVDSISDEQLSEAQSKLAYLDSLSDEEFELLLQQTGQLEAEKNSDKDIKTI